MEDVKWQMANVTWEMEAGSAEAGVTSAIDREHT